MQFFFQGLSINQTFGILAGVLSFSAYTLYIFTTIFGKTRPNRATWWVLTLVGLMIAASYYESGARATIWVAVSYVLGPLIIGFLSLKYGAGKWESLDKWCLGMAVASAFVWYISGSALLALFMNIFMDFVGLVPTIKKSYQHPESEDKIAWTLESLSGILNIAAIEKWTLGIAFYPLYLLIINVTITILLYRPSSKIN